MKRPLPMTRVPHKLFLAQFIKVVKDRFLSRCGLIAIERGAMERKA